MADRKPDEPPPAKLSDEFAAAIAAHKAFLTAYPNSVLSSDALRKITGVAVEYANIDAWDVAEGVYADLAKLGPQDSPSRAIGVRPRRVPAWPRHAGPRPRDPQRP